MIHKCISNSDDKDHDLDKDSGDPRKEEDWKLQKRRGFLKDREEKTKQVKQSKTAKRNSTEPLVTFGDYIGPKKITENSSLSVK